VSGWKWVVVALCVVQGGYMLLDGARALVVGSYITPGSGEHAGELGPWARLVSAVGIAPESLGMKVGFVVLGALWLVLGVGVLTGSPWAWWAGLTLAVGTLWYLVPGTLISLAVLVLLLTPALRDPR
jgi:hypothetical protein